MIISGGLTLAAFEQHLSEKMRAPDGGSSFRQIRSTLSQLKKNNIINDTNFIELFESTNQLIRDYRALLIKRNNRDITSATSHLRRLIAVYRAVQSLDQISDFNLFLRMHAQRKFGCFKNTQNPDGKVTLTEVSRAMLDYFDSKGLHLPVGSKKLQSKKVSKNTKAQTFANWMKSTKPSLNMWAEHLNALDEYFMLRPGTLVSKLDSSYDSSTPISGRRRRMSSLPLPSKVKAQFETYAALKLDGTPIKTINILSKEKSKFSTDQIIDTTKRKTGWSRSPDGECKSKNVPLNGLKGFFTFVERRSKESDSFIKEELELNLLADNELLDEYVDHIRSNKYAVQPALNLIRFIEEISRPNGYLRLGVKPLDGMLVEEWFSHLDELLKYIPHLKNSLSKNIAPPNDNKKAIRFLLERGTVRAYDYLDKMIEIALNGDVETTKKGSHHLVKLASVALILLLCRCIPLRINNWSQLQLVTIKSLYSHVDHPALLFDLDNSSYRIFVPKLFLKNRGRDSVKDISMPIPVKFNWLVDRYISLRNEYLLKNKCHTDYLFFKPKRGNSAVEPYNSSALGVEFKTVTKELISQISPELKHKGIHPHATRHLVATLFLNDNPENFVGLATLLNDSLKVVIDTYAEIDVQKQSQSISNWAAANYNCVT